MSKPRLRVYHSTSAYSAAKSTDQLDAINDKNTGANATVNPEQEKLRRRLLACHRNISSVFSAIEKNTTHEVGSGLVVKFTHTDPEIEKALQVSWSVFCREIDREQTVNLNGLLTILVRGRRAQGEMFLVKSFGSSGQLYLDAYESTQLDIAMSYDTSSGYIRNGIEYNRHWERVAYHFYEKDPTDEEPSVNVIRIPAERVIHHYVPHRAKQRRGVPDGLSGIENLVSLYSYTKSELKRKESRAAITGFIKRAVDYNALNDGGNWKFDPLTGDQIKDDTSEPSQTKVTPGTFIFGLPGDELSMFSGDDTGAGYFDFMRVQSLQIAQAFNLPYELLTGDWSEVNDRLVRTILDDYRRAIKMAQQNYLIHQLGWRIVTWFLQEQAFQTLNPEIQNTTFSIQASGWAYINPVQDVQAKVHAIQNDLSSTEEELALQGRDATETQRKNLKHLVDKAELAREMGLDIATLQALATIDQLQKSKLEPTHADPNSQSSD